MRKLTILLILVLVGIALPTFGQISIGTWQTDGPKMPAHTSSTSAEINAWMDSATDSGVMPASWAYYEEGPFVRTTDNSYKGAVYMPNGKVCFVPYNATEIGIFNPSDDSFATSTASATAGGFAEGVLLNNGKVLFLPENAPEPVGLYDPMTDTYATGTATPVGGAFFTLDGFLGGVVMDDGKVLCSDNIGQYYLQIYDPVADSFTQGPWRGQSRDAAPFRLQDGSIMITCIQGTITRYFPDTNTHIFPSGIADGQFSSGVLSPNANEGILIPNGSHLGYQWLTIDVTSNKVTYRGGSPVNPDEIRYGVVLPNGTVLGLPNKYDYCRIFDPRDYSTISAIAMPTTDYSFWGGVCIPDGRVILAPYVSDYVGIIHPNAGTFDNAECLSPWFNKL